MPVITPYYTVPSSGLFDIDAWNRTLYHPTDDDSLEVKNGRLDADNLHATFQVQPQHIRRGQAFEVATVGAGEPLDYHDDAESYEEGWNIVIPGAARTWYQKWDASVAVISFQAFLSAWRWNIPATPLESPNIETMLFVDGVAVPHTKRHMPVTVHITDTLGWPGELVFFIMEHYNTRLRSQAHTITGLSKGWHSVALKARIAKGAGVYRYEMSQSQLGNFADNHMPKMWYELHNRLSCGVRNMTVLTAL